MLRVGLTGGIATGKSTVAAMFAALGARLIDSDLLARQAVAQGSPGLQAVVAAFGPQCLTPAGDLDRPRLRKLIFHDPAARERLNAIVHPEVRRLAGLAALEIARREPGAVVMEDVPLLFETGAAGRYAAVVLVYLPAAEQLKRLMARDGVSREQAEAALRAQMPIEQKRRLAQFMVDNRGTLDETRKQVRAVWRALRRLVPAPAGESPPS